MGKSRKCEEKLYEWIKCEKNVKEMREKWEMWEKGYVWEKEREVWKLWGKVRGVRKSDTCEKKWDMQKSEKCEKKWNGLGICDQLYTALNM